MVTPRTFCFTADYLFSVVWAGGKPTKSSPRGRRRRQPPSFRRRCAQDHAQANGVEAVFPIVKVAIGMQQLDRGAGRKTAVQLGGEIAEVGEEHQVTALGSALCNGVDTAAEEQGVRRCDLRQFGKIQ